MRAIERMRVWRPAVAGVREVLHAEFAGHAYPMHAHDDWALLLVDDGAVRYRLGGRERHAAPGAVTLLPPDVAHDGRSALDGRGFRKRVVYLAHDWLDPAAGGLVADRPEHADPALVRATRRLHAALAAPGGEAAADAALTGIRASLRARLGSTDAEGAPAGASSAARLRDLLDAADGRIPALDDAAAMLGVRPDSLVRAFTREFGVPPHRYAIGRRVDAARRLIVDGAGVADAAARCGFADQSHLARHFRRTLGTTPGRFARGG